jgi:hypothetical protein
LVGFGYGFATWIGTGGGYWAVVYFIATHVHHRFVGWPVFAFVLLNGAVLIGSILLAFKVGADAVGRLTQAQDLADRDPTFSSSAA